MVVGLFYSAKIQGFFNFEAFEGATQPLITEPAPTPGLDSTVTTSALRPAVKLPLYLTPTSLAAVDDAAFALALRQAFAQGLGIPNNAVFLAGAAAAQTGARLTWISTDAVNTEGNADVPLGALEDYLAGRAYTVSRRRGRASRVLQAAPRAAAAAAALPPDTTSTALDTAGLKPPAFNASDPTVGVFINILAPCAAPCASTASTSAAAALATRIKSSLATLPLADPLLVLTQKAGLPPGTIATAVDAKQVVPFQIAMVTVKWSLKAWLWAMVTSPAVIIGASIGSVCCALCIAVAVWARRRAQKRREAATVAPAPTSDATAAAATAAATSTTDASAVKPKRRRRPKAALEQQYDFDKGAPLGSGAGGSGASTMDEAAWGASALSTVASDPDSEALQRGRQHSFASEEEWSHAKQSADEEVEVELQRVSQRFAASALASPPLVAARRSLSQQQSSLRPSGLGKAGAGTLLERSQFLAEVSKRKPPTALVGGGIGRRLSALAAPRGAARLQPLGQPKGLNLGTAFRAEF